MKNQKKKVSRGKLYEKNKDINLPKEDIKVEEGQKTFLPALTSIIKKNVSPAPKPVKPPKKK